MKRESLRVLSLQPWYGGSHRQFADAWAKRSGHHWTTLGLADRNWKSRMRHAAIDFAREVDRRARVGESWDIVFCTDMMNAAEFQSLAKSVSGLPLVVYFHENQFAYPLRGKHQPDHHFLFTNLVSALAADQVWFNSRFNLDSMLRGLAEQIDSSAEFSPEVQIEALKTHSQIVPPPINFPDLDLVPLLESKRATIARNKPLHLVWAARWEYDKNPAALLQCLELLQQQKVPFRLSVIGQQADSTPEAFEQIATKFETKLENWGYQESRQDYMAVLESADLFVSTADHEFFGLSVAEAISVGAWPLLPNRLAYPELLGVAENPKREQLFTYAHSPKQLASRIRALHLNRNWNFAALGSLVADIRNRLALDVCAARMDQMLRDCCDRHD